MGRPLRVEEPGAVYHVTARGNNREPIVLDDLDRLMLLEVFDFAARRSGWEPLAHCVMGNHFHRLIRTPQPTLARGMQLLCSEFARRFNKRHDHVGHVFQSRYYAVRIVSEAHLRECCRYIVLNPVRAGLCARAEEWEWSSFAETAGLVPPWLVALECVLPLFHRSPRRAYDVYRQFVEDGMAIARAACASREMLGA
jgi:REP element-mobilizing transposase RayT